MPPARIALARLSVVASLAALALMIASCGSGANKPVPTVDSSSVTSPTTADPTGTGTGTGTATSTLPGSNRPPITIGDKNYTEQFVLGELYAQALQAEGYTVQLNRNIGPTDVTLQALHSGRLAMYPEYLGAWNSSVAGLRPFRTEVAAYQAAQGYASAHGLSLLTPTPFSATFAIGVTDAYAQRNRLTSMVDLRRVAPRLDLGGPPQFGQHAPGLPRAEQTYGFSPARFTQLAVGDQYPALDAGTVQAAYVGTTDGELASGNYVLLHDPRRAFGFGNVVPVVSAKVLATEGQTFANVINSVSAALNISAIREMNAAVDLAHEDPATVAKQFLETHGLIPPSPS
jgi:osmoprotectant transport system substrate-binding protein